MAKVVPVPVWEAMEVAFPTEVIGPVRFALVVTVAALPVTDPTIAAVTVRVARVPTEVRELANTLAARVAPVRVPAAAVTVMSAEPLNDTPLIRRAV
jgi:hypothetical protein